MTDSSDLLTHQFQYQMVLYYCNFGRHELPWRLTSDPWQVLLAEMLLRKTRSIQVEKVYKILADYHPAEIVSMKINDLEEVVKPLGIYRVRTMQIQSAAKYVCGADENKWKGQSLLSLPGVGKYISNMVLCCAFNFPVPGLDANMIRILTRVFNYKTKRSRAREDAGFWNFAEILVPRNQCKEYNWGVLDFGAKICTSNNPKCIQCPINSFCIFYQNKTNRRFYIL